MRDNYQYLTELGMRREDRVMLAIHKVRACGAEGHATRFQLHKRKQKKNLRINQIFTATILIFHLAKKNGDEVEGLL